MNLNYYDEKKVMDNLAAILEYVEFFAYDTERIDASYYSNEEFFDKMYDCRKFLDSLKKSK